jgi:hypothetical protein
LAGGARVPAERLGTAPDSLSSGFAFVAGRSILAGMRDTTEPPEIEAIPADLLADFEAAAQRPLRQRMRYAFIQTHKPVMDDAPFRAFDTTADYRR